MSAIARTLARPGLLPHCCPKGRDARRLPVPTGFQLNAISNKQVQAGSRLRATFNRHILSTARKTHGRSISPRCAAPKTASTTEQIVKSKGPVLLWYRVGDLRTADNKGLNAVAEAAAKGSQGTLAHPKACSVPLLYPAVHTLLWC